MTIALEDVPIVDIDPYDDAFLRDPFPFYAELRRIAPVFRLRRYDCYGAARYAEVRAAIMDWSNFSSAAGVALAKFHKEKPWRPPSLLLETDPPLHDRARTAVNRVVTAKALRPFRDPFQAEANALLDRLLARRTIDGVRDIAEAYALKVFPDAVGLDGEGREHLLPYGDMVFNGFGPYNERFRRSTECASAVVPWITAKCRRAALSAGSLGAQIYEAADTGEITEDEAALLVRSFLGAGLDTTVAALAATVLSLAQTPDAWRALRADPSLARQAFEETIRLDAPIQNVFRTTTRAVTLGGAALEPDEKVLLFLGSANRDPDQWDDPQRYDLGRKVQGHVGLGVGLHACVGQAIARMEAEVLIATVARRVASLELTGTPTYRLNNAVRALATLPLRLTPA
ncbi:MAG: cytochrome P450 [Alphaproteobacteria bacterium]|nr:cytochrome P450 [Alphaproteobacteria bacterium]